MSLAGSASPATLERRTHARGTWSWAFIRDVPMTMVNITGPAPRHPVAICPMAKVAAQAINRMTLVGLVSRVDQAPEAAHRRARS
jgi:hypothetical protein